MKIRDRSPNCPKDYIEVDSSYPGIIGVDIEEKGDICRINLTPQSTRKLIRELTRALDEADAS
jgi:hypothetical protein